MRRYKYEIWTAYNDLYEGKATDAEKSTEYDSLKDLCFFMNLTPSRARNIISRSSGGELKSNVWTQVGGSLIQILKKMESIVTQILAAKRQAAGADTSALEAEVDRLVYGLYGLGEEEIKIIEGT